LQCLLRRQAVPQVAHEQTAPGDPIIII